MKKYVAKIGIPPARKNGKCERYCPLLDELDGDCVLDLDTPTGCPGPECPLSKGRKVVELEVPPLEDGRCSDECPLKPGGACGDCFMSWSDFNMPVVSARSGGCPRGTTDELMGM